MVTAQNTRSSLEKLMTDSRSSLQTYRNSLNESLIPKLSQSMDTLSALSGALTATLSDVDPTVEQLKLILTQLDTSLSDSSAALGQTGGVLDTIDQQLSTIATDLGVLQSSDIYNQLITLKGLDADSISDLYVLSGFYPVGSIIRSGKLWIRYDTILHQSGFMGWRTDSGFDLKAGSG